MAHNISCDFVLLIGSEKKYALGTNPQNVAETLNLHHAFGHQIDFE